MTKCPKSDPNSSIIQKVAREILKKNSWNQWLLFWSRFGLDRESGPKCCSIYNSCRLGISPSCTRASPPLTSYMALIITLQSTWFIRVQPRTPHQLGGRSHQRWTQWREVLRYQQERWIIGEAGDKVKSSSNISYHWLDLSVYVCVYYIETVFNTANRLSIIAFWCVREKEDFGMFFELPEGKWRQGCRQVTSFYTRARYGR